MEKRIVMFLLGCIPFRLALVYATAYSSCIMLKVMAVIATAIAIGFTLIYVFGWRKTGLETEGAPIWWNDLRPLHAVLWASFAYFAWTCCNDGAWKVLLLDTLIGLAAFLAYHRLLEP